MQDKKQWTKNISFKNPLHQNYKYSKALEMVLNDVLVPEYIHSVIVFTARSEFKAVMPENVCRGKSWLNYIKGFNQEVISPMKQKRVRYRIEKEVLEPSWKTDRQHVEYLKQKKLEKDSVS